MQFKPFKIANLINAQIGTEQEYEVEEPADHLHPDDPELLAPLSFEVVFLKSSDRIEATFANLKTKVGLICSRCLESFASPISIPFFAYPYLLPGNEHKPEEMADNFLVDINNNLIDVSDALRNEILLAIDGFPLCLEDCKGICSDCGVNRNEKKCTCTTTPQKIEEENKPFANLKTLVQHGPKKKKMG